MLDSRTDVAPDSEAALLAAVAADPRHYWTVLEHLPSDPRAAFPTHAGAWDQVSTALHAGAPPTDPGLGVPPSSEPIATARYLTELYRRRLLRTFCEEGLQGLAAGEEVSDIFTHLEQGMGSVRRALQGRRTDGMGWGDQLLENVVEKARHAKDAWASGWRTLGIPTGIATLDRTLNGFAAGGLYILGGPPGIGKTSLALQWACHAAAVSKVPVIYITYENTPENLVLKAVGLWGGVSPSAVEQGRVDEARWKQGAEAFAEFAPRLAFTQGDAGTTSADIEARAREALTRHSTERALIVVDYLQRMALRERYDTMRDNAAALTLTLREMAIRMGCPVLALSSLATARDGVKLTLASLSDRGDLEYAADVVMLMGTRVDTTVASLTRAKNVPGVRLLDILIAKNRYGEAGNAIPMLFRSSTGEFTEEQVA